MADRVYPSAKPAVNGVGENMALPPAKIQPQNASRPVYRPQLRHRSRRSCCCRCCIWTIFSIFLVVILAALSGALVWLVYRPQIPHFSVSSFQVSELKVTSSQQLVSKFNLTLTARNPNKKLVFFYDPTAISITSDGVDIGDGTMLAFTQATKNTTALTTTIGGSSPRIIDGASATVLKSKLKNSVGSLAVKIQLDTKVKVKMGVLLTKKLAIRVSCDGINAAIPTGKAVKTETVVSNAKCKVDLRIKIWKWTL